MKEIDNIGWFSLPAIHNGIPLNGFAYAGFNIVKTINDLGIKTTFMDDFAPVSISFSHPSFYAKNADQYRIGYTPWETTQLRKGWSEEMNEMDEIWATSNWVKNVFESSGVSAPVSVVPHGVDEGIWFASTRTVNGPMHFLHVGEPAERKNGKLVAKAFKKVFGNSQDVKLIVKAMEKTSISESNNIEIITKPYHTEDLANLYRECHVMVYPSNSEGFGMIPLQALSTGMPTILTPYSGMVEYSEFGIPIEFKEVDVRSTDNHGQWFYDGKWADPSLDDLCEKMLWVYENYDRVSSTAFENAGEIQKKFSWKRIISEAISSIKF